MSDVGLEKQRRYVLPAYGGPTVRRVRLMAAAGIRRSDRQTGPSYGVITEPGGPASGHERGEWP